MEKNENSTDFFERLVEDFSSTLPAFYKQIHRIQLRFFEKRSSWNPQIQILRLLSKTGELRMSEIGLRLTLQKPNVTATVNKLIEQGQVERVHLDNDRRLVLVRLTPKGEDFVEKFRQENRRIYSEILSRMDPEDIQLLRTTIDNLKRVIDRFERYHETDIREDPRTTSAGDGEKNK
jgi:DNA-binding MarR family transcriptional regulator